MNELEQLKKERDCTLLREDALRRELIGHREKAQGNYWAWQGDETDNLESLVTHCPVLIQAKDLLALKKEGDEALDLMRDEFKRIKALTENSEIIGLCDRAVTKIEQHTPLIVQRDNAIKERDQLEAKCASLYERNINAINTLSSNLPEVRRIKAAFRLLCALPPNEAEQDMHGLPQGIQATEGQGSVLNPGKEGKASGVVASEKGAGPGKVCDLPDAIQSKSPGKIGGGLSKEGPGESSRQDNSSECGCGGNNHEAETLSGLPEGEAASRASSRLQQAIRGGLVLHYLSREEASQVLNLSSDCGKGWVKAVELESTLGFISNVLDVSKDFLDDETAHWTRAAQFELDRLNDLIERAKHV